MRGSIISLLSSPYLYLWLIQKLKTKLPKYHMRALRHNLKGILRKEVEEEGLRKPPRASMLPVIRRSSHHRKIKPLGLSQAKSLQALRLLMSKQLIKTLKTRRPRPRPRKQLKASANNRSVQLQKTLHPKPSLWLLLLV